jgi:hypothetical protein
LVLAPLYLHHRYQVKAASKVIGGLDYSYAMRGDGQPPARPLSGERQRHALEVLLRMIQPESLDLSDSTLELLLPRPMGYDQSVEEFGSATAPAFDALGAAASAADLVVQGLLQPQRCARIIDFHRRDPTLPDLSEILEALVQQAFERRPEISPRQLEIQRVVQGVVVTGLIRLASDDRATPAVRAQVEWQLKKLQEQLAKTVSGVEAAQRQMLSADIARYLQRPLVATEPSPRPAPPPPGSPIGLPFALDEPGCSFD